MDVSDYVDPVFYDVSKKIVEEYNRPMYEDNGEEVTEEFATINKDGMVVWDIFMDTTGRFKVDPAKEYGIEGMLDFIRDYVKKTDDFMAFKR